MRRNEANTEPARKKKNRLRAVFLFLDPRLAPFAVVTTKAERGDDRSGLLYLYKSVLADAIFPDGSDFEKILTHFCSSIEVRDSTFINETAQVGF